MPRKPPSPFTERDAVPARMMAEMIAMGLDSHGGRTYARLATEIRKFAVRLTGVPADTVRRRVKTRDVFRPG